MSIEQQLQKLSPEKQKLLYKMLAEKQQKMAQPKAIAKRNENDPLVLSFAQERLWFIEQLEPGKSTYNVASTYRLKGNANIPVYEKSLNEIIRRHEILRMAFIENDGTPAITVTQHIQLKVRVVDIRDLTELERKQRVKELIFQEVTQPFDLGKAPLVRPLLIQIKDDEYIGSLVIHHIIFDAFSVKVLLAEITALYEAFLNNRPSPLMDLPIQYSDYALWHRRLLEGEKYDQQIKFWKRQLANLPFLQLPTDRLRPLVKSSKGACVQSEINHRLTHDLREFCRREGVTLFITLLSALYILYYRYSGQEDFAIGSPISGRNNSEVEQLIGCFINTLVLRGDLSGNPTFTELLARVKKVAFDAYNHQDVQFEQLVSELQPNRNMGYTPLFQVLLNVKKDQTQVIHISGMSFQYEESETGTAKFDISLEITEYPDRLKCQFEYDTDVFSSRTIHRLAEYYTNILQYCITSPQMRIAEIPILSKNEKQKLLFDLNKTQADYPNTKTIYQLFEAQVEQNPNNIALIFKDQQLSYRELNEKANQLGRLLRAKGVKADSIVGIMTERSLETVIGIMAVLKAGGAYLPVDPEYPEDRIEYMLTDSGTSILLTQKRLAGRAKFGGEMIFIEEEGIYQGETSNLNVGNNPGDMIYIIYTSGSTGKPKGVMIEHRGVVNYIWWAVKNYIKGDSGVSFPLYTTISFDLTVTSIFAPLISGNRIVIYGEEEHEILIQKILRANEVDIIKLTPAHLKLIKDMDNSRSKVKRFIVGGEQLETSLAKSIHDSFNGHIEIYNEYGPTETVVGCMIYKYDPEKDDKIAVPIGIPADNVQIYILDKYLKPVPVNVAGEMYISGDGVARGYLNREELNVERFIANPFIEGRSMYRTGDLARWLPDGIIEFLGRIDNQVKIRGYRIELGEIENRLLQHESIKDAVVIDRADSDGNKYLCAYIVTTAELKIPELREHLNKKLPEYMVPSFFIKLDSIPLTQNGKVDRKALPEPDGSINSGVEYVAPTTELEQKLAAVWQEVLGIDQIGINDDFFARGGHSLKATVLVAKIHKELDVNIPLKEVFMSPTIKAQAEYISKAEQSIYTSIRPIAKQEYYPLSPAQMRMYILWQLEGESITYNMPKAVMIESPVEMGQIEAWFKALITRHETLRTSFEMVNDQPVQRVHETIDFAIDYQEFPLPDPSAGQIWEIIGGFLKPFDLSKAPLFRVKLVRFKPEKHLLLLDIHHIISDGVSIDVLMKELQEISRGAELPELRVQYKDFAAWQNDLFQSGLIKKQEEYWLKAFQGELPILNLPTDYPRSAVRTFEGDSVDFEICSELVNGLNQITVKYGATLFMVILAAFNIMLARCSGQDDIIVGAPIAGRRHADLMNLIGVFLNTIALRNHPVSGKTFSAFLQEVKENTLEAFENQDYQFEMLLDQLKLERDLSRTPLFDVAINYSVVPGTETGEVPGGLKLTPYNIGIKLSKFDISLYLFQQDEVINASCVYRTSLFKRTTIEYLMGEFLKLLEAIVQDPEKQLQEYEILKDFRNWSRDQFGNDWQLLDSKQSNELNQFIYEFNDDFDQEEFQSLQSRIKDIAVKMPDKVAIEYGNTAITYRELDRNSDKIAGFMVNNTKERKNVAILMERSPDLIQSIIGVLKAGSIFVPVDPGMPENRIKMMLSEIQSDWVISHSKYLDKLNQVMELEKRHINVLVFDTGTTGGKEYPYLNLSSLDWKTDYHLDFSNEIVHEHCYIYFTSGSTGKPKAILGRHRSLVQFIEWEIKELGVNENFNVSQLTTPSFDPFLRDVFVPLCSGGKLCIPDNETIMNPMDLIQWIDTQKISLIHMVPSLFKVLSQQLEGSDCFYYLKYILLAGELLRGNDLKKFVEFFHDRIQLVNVYGPSETTLAKLFYRIHENDIFKPIIPVGKPIDRAEAVVLNNDQKPCMIGETGEIYIRTPFISSGYLNDTELTNKVFIKNPFGANPRDLIYKTGDLGRMLPDGNIEVLERVDNQVKIRGMKVDTKMVENIILGLEAVKDAVVIAKDDKNGNRYLCAYIIATKTIKAADLKKYLANDLPNYMIPSYMIQVDAFPLSPNGKLERKALPEPTDTMNTGVEYEAPSDMVEKQLAAIWQDILDLERVGINDQFFELGGNSLKAMTLVAKIHKTFNVQVRLSEIFKTQSLKDLAAHIKSKQFSLYSSIRPAEEKEYYTLSAAQKRMYILNQLGDIHSNYNISGVAVIEGEMDKGHFEEAFTKLLKRHESFRTSFEIVDGEPAQRIHQEVDFKPEYFSSTEDNVKEIIDDFIQWQFDLSKAPLLRIGIIEVPNNKHVLMYVMPHIISDGTSIGIFVRELISIYKGDELPELFIQYKDFSEWQNELFKTGIIQKQEEYWLKTFSGEIPVLNLPTDYSRPAIQSFEGNTVKFNLGMEITNQINKLVRETGSTLFMFLLAVYNVLLAKYTGQEDIVVGSPIAGRPHPDLEPIIGMFVNTLAMRNYPVGTKTFNRFFEEVRDNALKAFENQDYQFEELVEKLSLQRDLSRNPLFDTMFSLQNIDYGKSELKDLRITPYEFDNKAAKFDLTLRANEDDSEIKLELDYCTKLFKPETIQRLTGHFQNLVHAIIRDPQARLSELTLLSESEKRQLLDEFNSTKATYPIDMAIQTLFEAQVAQTPGNLAVVCGNQRLTYQELNESANQLAGYLRKLGVTSNQIVGIMVNGSLEMFIGILGILKAGGAYLPIDPEYPEERITYMLEDSGADILLTQSNLMKKAGKGSVIIDLNNHEIYDGPNSNPELINQPHDLAYVIYTSGSTGKPKGVKIEHRSLVNLAKWHNEFFAVTQQDQSTKFAGFGFDASVWEIFPYLIVGATLHVIEDDLKLDIEKLNDYYEQNRISISFLPTQFCEQFMSLENRSLRILLTGGDKLKHYEPKNYRLVNNYGPTENTVVSTSFFMDNVNYDNIPIGKPIANVKTYVLDKNNQLQPIGVPGELCITGVGLAVGYLNQPELTKEKFVANPFEPGARMYRTGDLVRWLPDGNIEFLGRIDHQVKIRGFRIELGEIENALIQHEKIKEVVVIDRQDIGTDKYLCAYIVADGEQSVPDLREYLARKLPAYMIPSFFTFLEKLPLTPNGKIDRNKLPQPDRAAYADEDYTAPRNEIEKILAGVWEEVLGIQKIGIHNNFFELGGNSLKAIQVVTKMVMDFEINVTDIFKYPEIAILAEKITLKSNYLDSKIREAVSFYKEAPKFNGKLLAKLLTRKLKYRQKRHQYKNKQFSRVNYQNILLTGSSGYLGIHLLYQLLTETDSNVHLLIRSNNMCGSEQRLAQKIEYYFGASVYQQYKNRLNVVNGDLSKDFLGISPDLYRDLGVKIDCIIHAAANVKHFGWYEDFYEVNVKGTERLLDFAIQNKIANFSFISTISVVAGAAEDGGMAFLTEYDTRLSEVTDSYYINSKIAAENIVLKARERGLNANIFRVGNLVFDSMSGKFQDNIAENAFYISMKSYIKLSRTPRIKLKTLDFSFVDYVAKAVVLLTTAKELSNETHHLFNRNLVSLYEIGELLSELEPSMKILAVEDFYDYLRQNYDHPELGTYSKNILMHSNVLRRHNQMKMFVFADKTNLILEKMNFEWPKLNRAGMEKMLNHCKTVNFM